MTCKVESSTCRTSSERAKRLHELHRNLHSLSEVVGRSLGRIPAKVASQGQVSFEQLRVLRFIAVNDDLRVGELADGLGIKNPSATAALDRLATKGLVGRRSDTTDARVVRLELTPSGRALIERTDDLIQGKLEAAMDQLGERDAEKVTDLMGELVKALLQGVDHFGEICLHCGPDSTKTCPADQIFGKCRYNPT